MTDPVDPREAGTAALARALALNARVEALLNAGDPSAALTLARTIEPDPAAPHVFERIRSGALINAGTALRDPVAIEEGIAGYESVEDQAGGDPSLDYNLANGLQARAATKDRTDPADWLITTAEDRHAAKHRFWKAADSGQAPPGLRTQAQVNLGNLLNETGRWVEALDAYRDALATDPQNGVAALRLAQLITECALPEDERLSRVSGGYARIAQENAGRVRAYAGSHAVEVCNALPTSDHNPLAPLTSAGDPYAEFVSDRGLMLAAIPEALCGATDTWDSIQLPGLSEPIAESYAPPPLFAMFNAMKSQYLFARRLLYEGFTNAYERPPTGLYVNTLDYGIYGDRGMQMIAGQRLAIDILDQIASAVNEYLQLGLGADRVSFRELWFRSSQRPKKSPRAINDVAWHDRVGAELDGNNRGVTALADLALDVKLRGYMGRLNTLRNIGTHRFVVIHSERMLGLRDSAAIEHKHLAEFMDEGVWTLRAARAALMYFLLLVTLREDRTGPGDGLVLPSLVLTD